MSAVLMPLAVIQAFMDQSRSGTPTPLYSMNTQKSDDWIPLHGPGSRGPTISDFDGGAIAVYWHAGISTTADSLAEFHNTCQIDDRRPTHWRRVPYPASGNKQQRRDNEAFEAWFEADRRRNGYVRGACWKAALEYERRYFAGRSSGEVLTELEGISHLIELRLLLDRIAKDKQCSG